MAQRLTMRGRSGGRLAVAVLAAGGVSLAAAVPTLAHPHAVARSLFERGSCVSFGPTVGHRHVRVFIDAGHGGPDPGGVGRTGSGRIITEAPLNVRVARDAAVLLRRHGFSVVLSRTGPRAVARPLPSDLIGRAFTPAGRLRDLLARNRCADRAHADLIIGMDFDAAASSTAAGSVTLYDAVRPFAPASLQLALLVQRDVLMSLRAGGAVVPDLGVHTDVGFGSALTTADRDYGHLVLLGPAQRGYLDMPTLAPGALIEPLFLTNPSEASLADSPTGQEAIGRGLAHAVEEFFSQLARSSARAAAPVTVSRRWRSRGSGAAGVAPGVPAPRYAIGTSAMFELGAE